ncbi:MAG TPA: hypothetical protein VE821_12935, partial [Pyrinomonadaceae bacterium]|nr:hypothetical protein [Pyrinomonadaceae bacterium]
MRRLIMRALRVCAFAIVFSIAAQAQTPAPQPNNSTNNAQAAPSLDDVRRQLQAQHEEIESLRATVKEQSQLLQQLLTHARAADTTRATVESANYSTTDVATTDALNGTTSTTTDASAQATTAASAAPPNASAQKSGANAPKPTEITTGVLSSISFSGDFRMR